MAALFVNFISILVWVLIAGIFVRILLSWIPISGGQLNPIVALIYQITEPILAPLRRLNLRIGMFDLTPTIALFILFAILRLIGKLSDGGGGLS